MTTEQTRESDEELALRIAIETGVTVSPVNDYFNSLSVLNKFALRFHAEKMKQIAGKSFYDWYAEDAPAEQPVHREHQFAMAVSAFSAGAATGKVPDGCEEELAAALDTLKVAKDALEMWNKNRAAAGVPINPISDNALTKINELLEVK